MPYFCASSSQTEPYSVTTLAFMASTTVTTAESVRVAKSQGYWGYIRVKMFAGWGKKFGRTCNFAKSSLFGKIYASFSSFPCKNFAGVILP